MASATIVVNLRTCHDSDVVRIDRRTLFGNPFKMHSESDRDLVIARYRVWFYARIVRDREFRRAVLSLRGKKLGCWCAPKSCHGDVIVEWLNQNEG